MNTNEIPVGDEQEMAIEKEEHTPLPWVYYLHECGDYAAHIEGRDRRRPSDPGSFRSVATILKYAGKIESSANAAFIVRACNAHDDLLATLELIVLDLESNGECLETDDRRIEVCKDAIAKAAKQ